MLRVIAWPFSSSTPLGVSTSQSKQTYKAMPKPRATCVITRQYKTWPRASDSERRAHSRVCRWGHFISCSLIDSTGAWLEPISLIRVELYIFSPATRTIYLGLKSFRGLSLYMSTLSLYRLNTWLRLTGRRGFGSVSSNLFRYRQRPLLRSLSISSLFIADSLSP